MKKLNKKKTNNNISMEAFGFLVPCYCYCGCERNASSRGVGQMYFSQDSKSTSSYNEGLGLYGLWDSFNK